MRTTIKDIAEYTGLSITTISLVLNNKAFKIPQETKKIIFEAAKKLNYRPNQVAVGLVKKRTNTIGLVISDVRNVFFSNLAKSVEDECRKSGWNLILCNTNDIHKRDMEYIRTLADKGVDGILFAMSADSNQKRAEESLKLMEYLKIPYVMIDRYVEWARCRFVATDHFQGGYVAAKHLIDLGHKKIACVTGPLYLIDADNRLLGYKKALEEANIPYDSNIVFEGAYTFDSGVQAVDFLKGKDFTAIFAFNDLSAYGVYKQLKKYNVNVPNDVSLVGYDNIFFSELLDVPLTTINQPIYDIGQKAAKLIINRENLNDDFNKSILLEPDLVIRNSTKKR